MNRSEEIWEDPLKFKPERFLSSDGDQIVNTENLIPFGYGEYNLLLCILVSRWLCTKRIFFRTTKVHWRTSCSHDALHFLCFTPAKIHLSTLPRSSATINEKPCGPVSVSCPLLRQDKLERSSERLNCSPESPSHRNAILRKTLCNFGKPENFLLFADDHEFISSFVIPRRIKDSPGTIIRSISHET